MVMTFFCFLFIFVKVWDACSDAHITFESSSKDLDGSKDMGFIVENPVTLEALRKQLKMLHSRVKVLHGTKLKKLSLPDLTKDLVWMDIYMKLIFYLFLIQILHNEETSLC